MPGLTPWWGGRFFQSIRRQSANPHLYQLVRGPLLSQVDLQIVIAQRQPIFTQRDYAQFPPDHLSAKFQVLTSGQLSEDTISFLPDLSRNLIGHLSGFCAWAG